MRIPAAAFILIAVERSQPSLEPSTTMKRLISDEALLELDQQTILLIAKRKPRS